ncbi:hypothetical protein ACFL20_13305 [Spirochaetota bacterium]
MAEIGGYRKEFVRSGVTFGSALAIVISYTFNKSILWAIFHGILSWIYVIYAGLFK